jgi:diguanylate cyclase (GGDEF)-like protein
VILPGQRIEVAAQVAERYRSMTPQATPPEMGATRLTASFGLIEAVPGDTVAALVQRADEALYRAKSLGRNRVERPDAQALPSAVCCRVEGETCPCSLQVIRTSMSIE